MNNVFVRFYLIFVVFALIMVSCDDESPMPQNDSDDHSLIPGAYQGGLFVLNEGNFNGANASVSYIDVNNKTVIKDVFQTVNNLSLGDVGQSIYYYEGKYFVVVNNSSKIQVLDASNFKILYTLSGFVSPRYMVFDGDRAYVSDLYGNGVYVVDLSTKSILKKIPFVGWTETMCVSANRLFVNVIGEATKPNSERHSFVAVVDLNNDSLIKSIDVCKEPLGMQLDKNGLIWVLSSGGYDDFEAPAFTCVNPLSFEITKIVTFPLVSSNPTRLQINSTKDTLYYLDNGIYSFPTNASTVSSSPLIKGQGHLFYGLGIDVLPQSIMVTDVVDYVQDGWLYRYTKNGTKIDSFKVGRNPVDMVLGR